MKTFDYSTIDQNRVASYKQFNLCAYKVGEAYKSVTGNDISSTVIYAWLKKTHPKDSDKALTHGNVQVYANAYKMPKKVVGSIDKLALELPAKKVKTPSKKEVTLVTENAELKSEMADMKAQMAELMALAKGSK